MSISVLVWRKTPTDNWYFIRVLDDLTYCTSVEWGHWRLCACFLTWMFMGWACGTYGWGEGVCRVLLGKPEGRRPLERPRRRWVDNVRMDLQVVGCRYMDWIGLAQNRDRWRTLVSAVMNLRVPWNAGNFLTSCKPVSFSRLQHGVSK